MDHTRVGKERELRRKCRQEQEGKGGMLEVVTVTTDSAGKVGEALRRGRNLAEALLDLSLSSCNHLPPTRPQTTPPPLGLHLSRPQSL